MHWKQAWERAQRINAFFGPVPSIHQEEAGAKMVESRLDVRLLRGDDTIETLPLDESGNVSETQVEAALQKYSIPQEGWK